MKLGSVSENLNFEKRISITPEIAKKYISLGFQIYLNSNYGSHLGFSDREYKELKVEILNDPKEVIVNSHLILQLNLLDDEKNNLIKENQTLIGIFNPYIYKEKTIYMLKIKGRLSWILYTLDVHSVHSKYTLCTL